MKVEELRPKQVVTKSSLQCEAECPCDTNWNATWLKKRRETALRRGFDPDKCTRGATVRIDGKPLCRQHAGPLALEELIKLSRAEHLED